MIDCAFMKLAILCFSAALATPAFAASCENLASLTLPDTKITLALGDNGTFSWKVSQKSVTNELTGDTTFANGILTLAPKEGSGDPLVGKVKTGDDGTFNFKAVGAPPSDPGLTFSKNPS